MYQVVFSAGGGSGSLGGIPFPPFVYGIGKLPLVRGNLRLLPFPSPIAPDVTTTNSHPSVFPTSKFFDCIVARNRVFQGGSSTPHGLAVELRDLRRYEKLLVEVVEG